MTSFDVMALVLLAVCCGLGARLGSVWVAASLAAGFTGSFLVDYYALPLSSMIGGFPGSIILSGVVLYVAALAVYLIPGHLLSKVEGVLLGVFDGIFGFFAGAAAGFCALLVILLYVVPHLSRIEERRAWKDSGLVRPLYAYVESAINDPHFQFQSAGEDIKDEALKKVNDLF